VVATLDADLVDERLEERLPGWHGTGLQALFDLAPRRSELVGVRRLEGHLLDGDDQFLASGA